MAGITSELFQSIMSIERSLHKARSAGNVAEIAILEKHLKGLKEIQLRAVGSTLALLTGSQNILDKKYVQRSDEFLQMCGEILPCLYLTPDQLFSRTFDEYNRLSPFKMTQAVKNCLWECECDCNRFVILTDHKHGSMLFGVTPFNDDTYQLITWGHLGSNEDFEKTIVRLHKNLILRSWRRIKFKSKNLFHKILNSG